MYVHNIWKNWKSQILFDIFVLHKKMYTNGDLQPHVFKQIITYAMGFCKYKYVLSFFFITTDTKWLQKQRLKYILIKHP